MRTGSKEKQRKEEEGKFPSIFSKLIALKEESSVDIPLRKPEKNALKYRSLEGLLKSPRTG